MNVASLWSLLVLVLVLPLAVRAGAASKGVHLSSRQLFRMVLVLLTFVYLLGWVGTYFSSRRLDSNVVRFEKAK